MPRPVRAMVEALRRTRPWLARLVQLTYRRRGWLIRGLSAQKLANTQVGEAFLLRRDQVRGLPIMVRSTFPRCARCPAPRACTPRDARLNVHRSTHFSFRLSEQRLRRLAQSGLTHLTVCVDGLKQESYERTRVGGNIALVLANLKRLCEIRRELGIRDLAIEVQYLKYRHNVGELEEAKRLLYEMGVDHVEDFLGITGSFMETDPGPLIVGAPRRPGRLPMCFWPYVGMVVKYSGDVIPCCNYRHGEQHARQVTRGRSAASSRTECAACGTRTLTASFCEGCPVLFSARRAAAGVISSPHGSKPRAVARFSKCPRPQPTSGKRGPAPTSAHRFSKCSCSAARCE